MEANFFSTSTRPWRTLSFEDALARLSKLFSHIQLIPMAGGPVVAPEKGEEGARAAAELARSHGVRILTLNANTYPLDQGPAPIATSLKQDVDLAVAAGASFILRSVNHDQVTDDVVDGFKEAAGYAAEKGVTLTMKDHGATGDQMRDAAERIGPDGFGLWYDLGNFIYYDNRDPVEEGRKIAPHVVGCTLKDCVHDDDGKPNVFVTPGDGEVDYAACFQVLEAAGFEGVYNFECFARADASFDEIEDAARVAIQRMKDILASV